MLGLATAHCCTRAGLGRVVLLERDGIASGPSGRAAALLTPEAHVWTDPPPFVDLARRSLDLWRSLDDELDGALGVEPADWIIALPDAVPPGSPVGERVEILDRDAAHALEPELGPADRWRAAHPRPGPCTPARRRKRLGEEHRAGRVRASRSAGVDVASSRVTTVQTSCGRLRAGRGRVRDRARTRLPRPRDPAAAREGPPARHLAGAVPAPRDARRARRARRAVAVGRAHRGRDARRG